MYYMRILFFFWLSDTRVGTRVLSVRLGVSVHFVRLAVFENNQLTWLHFHLFLLPDFHRVAFVRQHEGAVDGLNSQVLPVLPGNFELDGVIIDLQYASRGLTETVDVDGCDWAVTRGRLDPVQVARSRFFAIGRIEHPLRFRRG